MNEIHILQMDLVLKYVFVDGVYPFINVLFCYFYMNDFLNSSFISLLLNDTILKS